MQKKQAHSLLFAMFRKGIYFLGFLIVTSNCVICSRVKLEETLERFLGTLETYASTSNDVVFLLDESGSIGADRFPEVKKFTELIVRRLSVSSEHSRIAIVTFATDPKVHVNYIKDSVGNNMCSLIKKIDDIGYVGEWTHTYEAMVKAKEILAQARQPSNKIIILLTDGESNDGHKPEGIANELKKAGIIIFAVGVAKVNVKEINAVASSINHTYILTNFSYIYQVNKDLVKDTVEISWDAVNDVSMCNNVCSEKSDCCDIHANCYCGTRSGVYDCACSPGYSGSGHKGECNLCPKGTYKNTTGKSACTDCPDHSNTRGEGSTSFDDCICDDGYVRNGTICSPIKCASLSAPEGGILVPSHCGDTFDSTCDFKCKEGYCPYSCNKTNSFSDVPFDLFLGSTRRCLASGHWNGEEFHCEKVRCPPLDYPAGGNHNCSGIDFTFRTTCSFSCDKGYKLSEGSKHRTCRLTGSWTGSDVRCKDVYCDRLKTNELLQVKPKKCGNERMRYGSTCQYYCIKGYNLTSSLNITDGINQCLSDGTWSGAKNKITCKDIQPPNIQCPKSVVVYSDPSKPTALVSWDEATAIDNGIAGFLKRIEIKQPNNIRKSPHAFPIGVTKVVYEATDHAGLTSTCSFSVTVLDKEPPQITNCTSNIEVYHEKNTHIPVTWDEPKFQDNSGKLGAIISNRNSGDKFAWGPPSIVYYSASDPSGNKASCSFSVAIKPYPCPYYDPPANGALTCDTWENGRLCSVNCFDGYAFASNQKVHDIYQCLRSPNSAESHWVPFPASIRNQKKAITMWPDCSEKKKPISYNMSVSVSVSVVVCSPETLEKMKNEFIQKLMPHNKRFGGLLCPKKNNVPTCSPENVNVTCSDSKGRIKRSFPSEDIYITMLHKGKMDTKLRMSRIRRQTAQPVLTISFNFEMDPNKTNVENNEGQLDEYGGDTTGNQDVDSFLKDVNEVVSDSVKDIYNLTDLPHSETQYKVFVKCLVGQMKINNSCINCPRGTYKDDLSETCRECPQASYQDKENSLSCKPCPIGYTTYQVKSKSDNDCKAPCKPGTHSQTTFEPCLSCPFNTYQESQGRKDCLKCPPGLETWKVGSNSSSDCVSACKPGSYSDTGYEPCKLCDIDAYQSEAKNNECISCPIGTRAEKKGATSLDDCIEFKICDKLHPCPSFSTCVQQGNNYECVCPKGLFGAHCEINLDDCASEPCLNDGTCTDEVGDFKCLCATGFLGKQCEININDCKEGLCLNDGECEDMVNDYKCNCKPGYTGRNCEINIFECSSNPCLNGGTCFDMENDYRCCCPEGYFGKNCGQEINFCNSIECQNGGSCYSSLYGFNCTCPLGFSGEYCEVNIDDCSSDTCQNGGTCVDGIVEGSCICPPTFAGKACEIELLSEYVLKYTERSTSNYVELKNNRLLHAITVSFFMRTSFKDVKSRATPLSYSYKVNGKIIDNALTLLDTNRIVLYLHGEMLLTGYIANRDSEWHHYAVTWEQDEGKWSFNVDGSLIVTGSHVGEQQYMWPGIFILGQEQDSLGGTFNLIEAFEGDITEFNVWDYAFSQDEISKLSASCGLVGNVVPWPAASDSIHGSITVSTDVPLCRNIGICSGDNCNCIYSNQTSEAICKPYVGSCEPNPCQNEQLCESDGKNSFCNCSLGFEGKFCEYDIDECLLDKSGCDYDCINTIGSYTCTCPDNMIIAEDGKTCKETGFCKSEGQIHLHGEEWFSSCHTCSCEFGAVLCQKIQCNETDCSRGDLLTMPGECCPRCITWSACFAKLNTSLKFPIVTTFHMTSYEFTGNCTYTLVEDCIHGRYKVLLEPTGNGSEKNLLIYQDCMKILITPSSDILVDDNSVLLPFENMYVRVVSNNGSIDVLTQSGLQVHWDNTGELLITVPTESYGKLCGLCANSDESIFSDTGKYYFPERTASAGYNCYGFRETHHQNNLKSVASYHITFPPSFAGGYLLLIILCICFNSSFAF